MEREDIVFTETQRFKQWWLWLIFFGLNGKVLFDVFKQFGNESPDRTTGMTELLISAGLVFSVTILFIVSRLETVIKQDGIYVRFFPFHIRFKHYHWHSLTKAFVRQYSPVTEYGGWGLRLGLFGKGAAYNISGNQGLQLELTNSKKLLIGTNKPDELSEVLKQIGQLKE